MLWRLHSPNLLPFLSKLCNYFHCTYGETLIHANNNVTCILYQCIHHLPLNAKNVIDWVFPGSTTHLLLIIHLVKKGCLQSVLILYLDVTISSDLHWDKHVGAILAKATKTLNVVRRNIYRCPPDVKALVYTCLIRPHLEFASAAWDTYTASNATDWIKYTVELLSLLKVIIVSDLGWQPMTQHRKMLICICSTKAFMVWLQFL